MHIFIAKKSASKWTLTVQTSVVSKVNCITKFVTELASRSPL